jgi:hypothetical protein
MSVTYDRLGFTPRGYAGIVERWSQQESDSRFSRVYTPQFVVIVQEHGYESLHDPNCRGNSFLICSTGTTGVIMYACVSNAYEAERTLYIQAFLHLLARNTREEYTVSLKNRLSNRRESRYKMMILTSRERQILHLFRLSGLSRTGYLQLYRSVS